MEDIYLYKSTVGSSHTWAIEELKKLPLNSRVLDFGAGSGVMGKKLSELGQSQIYAVDLDPDRQEYLSQLYLKCTTRIEELQEANFDCIILLDILEHLTNPFEFLADLTKLLNPKGTILISVPNIAHWSIRISLLFGFFEYTERGLLDKTHYSFFNKKRAIQLAAAAPGTELISYSASVSPAEFVFPNIITKTNIYKSLDRLRLKIANIFPAILGYQHLMKIRKKV